MGDGTGATATATIDSSFAVSNITITNAGSGYTWMNVYVVGGNVGGYADAILAPLNGHGSNIVIELGGNTIIANIQIKTVTDYIGTGNDNGTFREISIISNVKEKTTNIPATKTNYIGSGNTHYNETNTLNKMNNQAGDVLYTSTQKAIVRSDSQQESINVVFDLSAKE